MVSGLRLVFYERRSITQIILRASHVYIIWTISIRIFRILNFQSKLHFERLHDSLVNR
jgi:hypothetical protein